MKGTAKKKNKAPPLTDLEEWRRAATEKRLRQFRLEDIVAAIQQIGPNGDQRLMNDLMGHVSDAMLEILRSYVSKSHRNEGRDIIESAHGKLILAVLNRDSADGKGLTVAFAARVRFRADDALVVELRELERYQSYEDNYDGGIIDPAHGTPPDSVDQLVHVEHLLSKIHDPRKYLAFRLYMDGCPISPGKGTTSIAEALGVSAKTAGVWVAEIQAFLKRTGVSRE